MKLWVAGRYRGMVGEVAAWELLGVYSTRGVAVARCRATNDFVAPAELDVDAPEPLTAWWGTEYPVAP